MGAAMLCALAEYTLNLNCAKCKQDIASALRAFGTLAPATPSALRMRFLRASASEQRVV